LKPELVSSHAGQKIAAGHEIACEPDRQDTVVTVERLQERIARCGVRVATVSVARSGVHDDSPASMHHARRVMRSSSRLYLSRFPGNKASVIKRVAPGSEASRLGEGGV